MIPWKIFTGFAKFQGIVSVNDFRFPIWLPRTFATSFVFPVKFLFCTDTTWLFRDSQLSLRTLWSAVIKSPKFSARSTAPPVRLLHGSLLMLVLWQISHFRSFGEWVSTLCLPKSAHLVSAWEELACESLCSRTLSSTSCSLNSCRHSGIPEWHGSLRSWSFFGWLVFLVGLGVSPFMPYHMFTLHNCRMMIYPARVSPFLSSHTLVWLIWLCHGWWRRRTWGRRGMINFLPWTCHGCWRKQAWRRTCWYTRNHDRYDVLRIALYPNTVLNEMWFLTVDPLVRVSVFTAKLSLRWNCWRILEEVHCQEYTQFFDVHFCLFMRLHFAIGCYDYCWTKRFRQSIHFSITQVLFADHVHRRSGVDNKFSFLWFNCWWRRWTPIFRRWEECKVDHFQLQTKPTVTKKSLQFFFLWTPPTPVRCVLPRVAWGRVPFPKLFRRNWFCNLLARLTVRDGFWETAARKYGWSRTKRVFAWLM